MSPKPSDSDDLEEALESTRRNVRQLEMDTCRVRNDLTRLEVALEGGITGPQRTIRHAPEPTDAEQQVD